MAMIAGDKTRSAHLSVHRTTEEAGITVRTANPPFEHHSVRPPGGMEAGIATLEAPSSVALRAHIKGTLTALARASSFLETLETVLSPVIALGPTDPFRMPPQRENENNDQTDQPPRRRRNRRKRDGSAPEAPRPRRAPAPQWHFPVGHPLADAPKSSSSIGPFHATTPMLGKSGSKSRPGDGDAATEGNIPKEPSSPSQQRGKRDLITPPSAQSGGVPDPTAEYLEQAALPPANPLSKPQPLLVVLDLNGTVIYRKGHKKGSGQFSLRPFAQTFLELCLDRHHLVIWSSARPETVQAICTQLFSRVHRKRILAIWARDRFGLTTADYNLRTQCYKRLTRVWADPVIAGGHPRAAKGGRWSQANTVLIDDSIEKARSEPHNAVTLPEFNGNVDEKPLVLELVAEYLQTLALQKDVSAYIRAQPFAVKGQREESVPASQSESQGEESQGGGEVVMKEDWKRER
ncbi:HAD-like domain-containing protein [Dichotomopilus funicola]|uniref:Mitochondrial import inner membrane translocase subunit TIM50 n=1 Tax=Dichotomopilus funicola TaxID=1934379 RepID=A0AAN6VBD6_9PEZI|nr:HAD-like domain-containing protein [Dichotomopilus funicola]